MAILLNSCNLGTYVYYDDIYTTSGELRHSVVQSTEPQQQEASEDITYQNQSVQPDSIVYEYDEDGNLLDTKAYYFDGNAPEQIAGYNSGGAGGSGNTYINNYYYDEDDYYDYYYTSRIRRFHTDLNCGWGYYDPYFTNLYWYDYCPSSWGVSIYLGYDWWWPTYYRPYYYSCVKQTLVE